MEAVRFVSPKNEIPDLSHSLQPDEVKSCLTSQENVTKQSSASLDETNAKEDAPELLTECTSDNKENIAKNNVVINEESNTCATIPLNYSFLTCAKKLLESSDDEEKDSGVEKFSKETGKLLQIPKKLKFLNDTISTPPSALREQISILRKEMNEAYEFHDLEIEILKGENKEDPENYAELIEKYSTLLELYTSLKNEYEEYRKKQEKVRDELQSTTVDCLESLCSQIEASDNSLSNASIVSFNTDFKSSTMIGTFIEEETTLLHDVTIQTKDPLSNTDVFKTPKSTPLESSKKLYPRILIPKYNFEHNVKLAEVESAFRDKEKEIKELEQRLFQIEDLSGILQIEFEKISTGILKENENLKKNLLNKTEELDVLIQKLFTEIVSLNPSLAESLTDSPGAKLLAVFIETIMERCKNIQDKLIMKFNTEKSLWETKMNSLEEENKNLNEQIARQTSAFEEMKKTYERQILETESLIFTKNEEIQKLKTYESNTKKIEEDLELARKEITKLESCKNETEDKCRSFEKTNHNLRLDLEELKNLYGVTQNENCKLHEQLLQIREENGKLKELCQRLEQDLSEREVVISARDEEILNLKNKEIKQMKAELAEASEMVLKLKAELFTTEGEKLKFEKRCSELEDANGTLQTVISTKDIILKNLESFKSSCENEWENMKQQVKEMETVISSLKVELETTNNKYCMELKKVESLNDEINQKSRALEELRTSYENIQKTLLNKEEEIQTLRAHDSDYRRMQDELASAKQTNEKLKTELVAAEDDKKELKAECQVLEEKITNLCFDLEKIQSAHKKIEIENVNLENMIYKNDAKFKFESVFEILQEGKKALKAALSSKVQTENVAFELIAEQISSSPEIVKLIENIVEYFNIEWEAKQNVLIENFKNEIKITSERVSEISAENASLQEIYDKVSERLTETESVISFRDEEILKLKNETALLEEIKTNLVIANEKILELENELDVMKREKLNYEKRCQELEDVNSTLQVTIAAKEGILRELEDFKHSCEIEQQKLKRQITTNEDIIKNLKEVNEKLREEIKKSLLEDISSSLQVGCEKLKDILSSGKYLNTHVNDLLKLLEQSESPYTETENLILTQLISAVTDVRNKLLLEWDEQKNHNATLIRGLENEVSDGKKREAEFRKLCLELEDAKAILETEITTKDSLLKDLEGFKSAHAIECVKIKQEIEEKDVIISDLKIELRVVEETYREKTNKIEREKLESESRCLDLEDINFNLRSVITNKDATLKELEDFKLYFERDLRDVKEQLQDREVTIKNLRSELERVKEEFSENLTKLNGEKINLEKRCSELEEVSVNLQNALTAKDIALKDLENLKNSHVDECDRLKHQVKVKEDIIVNLKMELVSVKNKWSEEVKKMEIEKVEFEHRYVELEEKIAELLSSTAAKEKLLKDLEEFKSLHGDECEIIKQQLKAKEEIISKLKAELDAVKEKLCEEVKKSNADNILSGLKVNYEKLKDILGSEKYLNLGRDDLLKLLEQTKSPDTETEARVFTEVFSVVFDVRSKLLQEWEMQKNNDVRLVKELKSEISDLRRREAAFDNANQGRDRGDGKIFHEDDSIHDLAGFEKLKLSSVKDFPKVMTKIMVHVKKIQSRSVELKEENEKLDEECDSYAKVIKDLKKEAAVEWKKNNAKMLSLEAEIQRLTEVKNVLDNEKQELLGKISKLEEECQRPKTNIVPEGAGRNCGCGVDLKKVNELKRTILVKEQKLMELQELEAQNNAHKSQIEYLKNALDKERKKINEERERNKKLENEIKGVAKNQKGERKDLEEKQILEELRMRGSISGGVVQEIVDKEKMRKLSKDVGVLKEICRARYAEIKRLEAENAALKKITTKKNSNQMDSPIRSTSYSPGTRSKSFLIEKWKTEMEAKENRAL